MQEGQVAVWRLTWLWVVAPPLHSTVPWGQQAVLGGGTASARPQLLPQPAPRAAGLCFASKPEPARRDFSDADGLRGHGQTLLPTGTLLWGWVCSLPHSSPLPRVSPGGSPKDVPKPPSLQCA